ncbi:MAG: glycosyltransferase [Acidimicrobiaceae bacterium]|nr:MAG: glycosyltransferase [Acidimicrobiaceae bacterium]
MSASCGFGFDHVERLSDGRGMFEHAEGVNRREEHGYCTDDNARLLVVTSRVPDIGPAHRLGRLALRFVLDAQGTDGRFHNRMDRSGRWTDQVSNEDCWGRSLWGLGVAAAHHADPAIRRRARGGFDVGARQRSPWSRAMAFAALGAADVLASDPGHAPTRELLVDALSVIGPIPGGAWSWPEARLTYANAALAEAVIAAGDALDSPSDLDRGLAMLGWLLDLETPFGHLSVTGVGGRGPGDRGPMFDQQPIEVAAMADACWRAHAVTGDRSWLRGVIAAAAWFDGSNDIGLQMHDDQSGGGFDGLQPDRLNLNQGAESTLAFISTMQRAGDL